MRQVLQVGVLAATMMAGHGARADCANPDDFRISVRNVSPHRIESVWIEALDEFQISTFGLAPRSSVDLCLKRAPKKCKTIYQVDYKDFPPITYDINICKNRNLKIKRE